MVNYKFKYKLTRENYKFTLLHQFHGITHGIRKHGRMVLDLYLL